MGICLYCSKPTISKADLVCCDHAGGFNVPARQTPELKGIHRQQERLRDLLFRHVHVDDHLLPNTEFIRAVMDRHLADRDVHLGDPNE